MPTISCQNVVIKGAPSSGTSTPKQSCRDSVSVPHNLGPRNCLSRCCPTTGNVPSWQPDPTSLSIYAHTPIFCCVNFILCHVSLAVRQLCPTGRGSPCQGVNCAVPRSARHCPAGYLQLGSASHYKYGQWPQPLQPEELLIKNYKFMNFYAVSGPETLAGFHSWLIMMKPARLG